MWEILERIGLIITLIGFITLGYFSYQSVNNNKQIIDRINLVEISLNSIRQSVSNSTIQQFSNSCDASCIRKLVSEAVASISGITKPQKEQVIEKIVEKVTTPTSQIKSQYVPLGAGSTSSTSWADAPGAQVTLNLADFGSISQIYFEAQLSSPSSGKVYARLWDSLNGVILSSEISANSGDPQLVSTKVNIGTGGRTIKVQLRSEVQQPVSVLESRLRIDTK